MEAIIYATLGLIAIPVIRTAIKSYRANRSSRRSRRRGRKVGDSTRRKRLGSRDRLSWNRRGWRGRKWNLNFEGDELLHTGDRHRRKRGKRRNDNLRNVPHGYGRAGRRSWIRRRNRVRICDDSSLSRNSVRTTKRRSGWGWA